MKPNFALDLTHDGISLLFRADGGWAQVGDVALDDPRMSEHLKALHDRAMELGEGNVTTKLIIPDSQVLYTTVEAPGPDDTAREVQIRVALEGMTPYAVSDLVFDWRAEGDVARVAVLAHDTMEEAEGFATQFGFNPVSFVARPSSGQFSGEPFFGKTRGAARILGASERVTPDATPVPRNPRKLPGAAPEPEATAEDAPRDTQTAEPARTEPVPAPSPSPEVAKRPALDAFPSDPAAPAEPAEPATPRAPAATRKPRASAAPPVLAPFPPTPEDPTEISTKSTYRPVQRSQPSTPPAPKPKANGAQPLRAEPAAPEATAAPKSPEPASDEDAPAFSSRRVTPAAGDEAAVAKPAPRVTPPASPDKAEPKISDIDDSASEPAKGDAAETKPKPVLIDDTRPAPRGLSGEAETRRQAMARAISAPPPKPGEEKPGLLSRVGTGLSGLSGSAGARLKRPAKADVPAPAPDTKPVTPPKAPKPVKDAKPKAEKSKPRKDKDLDARSKEAESMTVFGARRMETARRGRPRYMGLILTLVLLLLMAAAAIWSTVFLGDEDVALFNPDPASAPVTTPDPAPVAQTPAEDVVDNEPEPAPAETADTAQPENAAGVLSAQEADAQYAVTGVYQRAPEPLGEPETARGDDVYVASIDPAVEASDALALPEPGAVEETPPDAPIPPPPPGTTFDLNEDGLVIATPEGAVSPTGVIVIQGRPDVVPRPRPEDLVPEAQDDAALDLPEETPTLSPRARPGDLAETTERAQLGGQTREELAALRPRARPADLNTTAPAETQTAALDAAVADALNDAQADEQAGDEADLENVTELAVATSRRPDARPSNFQKVVAQARSSAQVNADNSDGSTVVAAAARSNQPIIPSATSVARQATMKNALNLNKVNLIGVYGSNSSRRALVRMGNGRYVKVSVGDRLDGGKVIAISDERLVYQKGSRQYALDVLPLG